MKNKGKYFIFLLFTAFSINHVAGQETNFASNVKKSLSVDGKGLTIEYDLEFADTTQLFDIILKIDHKGNVIQPLENDLHGDCGNRLKPGMEKIIMWDFPNDFKGGINELNVDVIAIKTRGPLAGFDFKILTSKPPFDVKFTNKSKNADMYSWNFNDLKSGKNNLSTLESPVHRFKSAGNYNIELTAGNSINTTSNTTMKVVALGKGNEQELQKHKKLRTIWLGSAIATTAVGGFSFLKYIKTKNEWRTEPDIEKYNELEKKYKTYMIMGAAAVAVTGVCITQVFIQTKKIRTTEQALSINYIPLNKGGAMGLAWNF